MSLDVGDLVARIRLDGLREFENDQRRAENSFRDLGRQADRSTSNLGRGFQDARRDVTQLSDTTSRSGQSMRQDLQRTEQTGRQSANTIGNAFRDSMRSAGEGMRSELDRVTERAGESGGSGGSNFLAAFGSKIAGLGSKGGPIAAALVGVAAVGIIAGKTLADAVEQGFELQQGRDFSAAKFGLNPAQMEQAGKAAGDAYGNAWGESVQSNIDTAGIGIQTGLIKPGASAAEMQPVIEKLSMVSELMGTEIPETARAAGQMIKTGLVGDGVQAMDLLTAAQQKGLNISDDLLDTVNEYGTQYRKLGLDGKTALGTISQMMQGGARDSDIAADALKEFSLRVVDGSESTTDAYTSLGLNVQETAEAFGKGGAAAAGMSQTVIQKLRDIKDPVERNRIGVELFGTQWEDLGGAINRMDLSKAAGELGQVDGAADRAGGTMNNAANSITAAKNKISVAADNVKLKLGEAFAPAAMDLGNWITEHQDEIVDFFKAAADGALIFTQGMLQVTAGAADMAAAVMRAGANFLDYFVIPVLNGVQEVGSLMSHLPGSAGKMGEALRDGAKDARESLGQTRDSLRTVADGTSAAADGMRNFSDHIQGARENLMGLGDESKGSTNPAIQTTTQMVQGLTGELNKLPRNVPINVETPGGQTALNLLQSLGIQTHVDNNKNIVVDAPMAPAVLEQLKALGVSVRTDNGKTILVTDNNTATITKDKIDAIARERRIAYIDVQERMGNTQNSWTAPNGTRGEQGPGLYAAPRASGGPVGGNGGPRADDQLIWASSPEWVIQSSAAQKYGPAAMNAVNNGTAHILAYANGGQVGMTPEESARMGGGTVNASIWAAVKANNPSAQLTSAKTDHDVDGGLHPKGEAIDVDPSETNLNYLWSIRDQLAMVISAADGGAKNWYNMNGERAEGQAAVAIYGADVVAQHANHIHAGALHDIAAASAAAAGQPGARTIPLIKNPDGTYTSSDPAWAALIKRESGGDPDIVQQINDVNSGGNEASGLFQIAKGTWASNGGTEYAPTAGEADPEKQAIVAARIFDQSGGSPWGAGLPGREDEAGLRAGITTSAPAPAMGSDPLATASGVQNVFVTGGRLDGATSSTDTSTTPSTKAPATPGPVGLGPLPIAAYANGGFGPAPDKATVLNSAKSWMTLAGEAGPEAFIPIDGSPRSIALWMETGKRLGAVKAYAQGGFGGYSDDTRDYMAPTSLSDYLALGVGAGFTAASVAAPYIGMATGKQVDLGNLSPTMDTGSNSVEGVAQMAGQWLDSVQKQLTELTKAVREQGKTIQPVRVTNQPRQSSSDGGLGVRMATI